MPALSVLLAQLRATYPMASLVSEFAGFHEGQYVVRSLVQINGITLASGLATNVNLEAAEDRAKVRSLEAFGIHDSGASVTHLDASAPLNRAALTPVEDFRAIAPESYPSPSAYTAAYTDPLANIALSAEAIATPETLPIAPERMEPPSIVADLYAHITDEDEVLEDEEPVDLSKIVQPATQLLGKTSRRKTAAPPPEPEPPPPPLDFSDVLAQTDVELRRLGWDAKRGREHLKQSYGKRARSELSETELYDFLSYLKTQST